jgi:alanine-glyoxylate transaminase/serine-glyoxylate transaminase/serine-pyruvate transaminase
MANTYAALRPPKRLLFGPGPTMVEPRVYEALGSPIVGHLDPFFFEVVEDIRKLLMETYGTANPFTMAVSGTGSGGMETAVSNFVEAGSKLAVLANGFFCDRIAEMGSRNGATVVRLDKPWGEAFTDAEVAEFVHRERPQVLAFVQAETSTGVYQPGKAFSKAAHDVDAVVIADCVTSLGGLPVNLDENGIDVAFSCSQKGLSCPPGLSPISVSPRAMERLRSRKTPIRSWYFDLKLLDDYYDGSHRYHHTAPISMFYALREALVLASEEGLKNRFDRHLRNHLALVAGLEAMGLEMLVAEKDRLWTLNTPKLPGGVDDVRVRKYLISKYGIEIAGGFGPLAGKVFRIGLMGPLSTEENTLMFLDAFEEAMRDAGYAAKGSPRSAAEDFYAGALVSR